MTDNLAEIKLKKNEDRRIMMGHLWIFSNEIDTNQTPLKNFTAGQHVTVKSATGRPLATAYINPHSLIAARIISFKKTFNIDQWLEEKITTALALRQQLFNNNCYRLIYSEGDNLPGVIVDRFNDVLIVQITTAGIEVVKDKLTAALKKIINPSCIYYQNDSEIRKFEQIELYKETALGELPEFETIIENDCQYKIALKSGQKTGWFYDQRFTRAQSQKYTKGKSVLDLFSYAGSFGILAAKNGATEVVCVDSSQPALNSVIDNAKLNNVSNLVTTIKGDSAKVIEKLVNEGKRFDVVLIDPPALIKRKKDFKKGVEVYRAQNYAALQIVKPGGILISSSCSQSLPIQTLQKTVLQCARALKLNLQIIEKGGQAADHPIHAAIPETEYLKTIFCRVT